MASNPAPLPAAAAPAKFRHLRVGDLVHYYDDSRAQTYGKFGAGPYAAIVTFVDVGGPMLKVFAPVAGHFDVERVAHKTQLDARDKGRQRWWQWPHESEERK